MILKKHSCTGRKLLAKFRKKTANYTPMRNCVLIIDINQMSCHTLKNGNPVSPTFEEVIETVRNESKFGLKKQMKFILKEQLIKNIVRIVTRI